jgi:hypothetical protein
MKNIPTEIDRLMWAVAENPNPQAVLEFEARYPTYRIEMLKRVEMVRGLRQEVKGPSFRTREIPRFEPKPVQPTGVPRGTFVALGLAVVALVFATFAVLHAPKAVPPKPLLTQEFVRPAEPGPGVAYHNPPNPIPQVSLAPPPSLPMPSQQPLAERRRSLNLKDVDLVAALALVTSGTNIKLEVGPGFVNQKVTLSFKGATTREMLFEMAKDYAFTVSDEGDNRFLVLPVPDNQTAPEPTNESPRRVTP